jgi:hypothetical protein
VDCSSSNFVQKGSVTMNATYMMGVVVVLAIGSVSGCNARGTSTSGSEASQRSVCQMPLDKIAILRAATDYAARNIEVSEYNVTYDEANAAWSATVSESSGSGSKNLQVYETALLSKDYQTVVFTHRTHSLGGRLWVFVDRCSGNIITSCGEK